MTTAMAKRTMPTIQLYAQSLAPQERSKHRFWIGLRVEALMESYWQNRPSDAVKEMIVADWLDALENYAPQEITVACREYLSGPNRTRKPKPGDIVDLMLAVRKRAVDAMPKAPEPPRHEPSEEERARVFEIVRGAYRGME